MAARSNWEGFLKINLVSIPVKAFTANNEGKANIRFNQLHAECNSRIRYKKVCPIHGEVPNDEIVSGYEAAKDEYVVPDKGELSKLKTENEKTLQVDAFVSPEEIDPVLFSGRTYYLVPDGKLAKKSYAVVHRAMREHNRFAVAEIVFVGREHIVAIRPMERLLAMSFLNYRDEVKAPEEFEDMAPETDVSPKELQLAESLIEASTVEEFDFGRYKDDYNNRVKKLIEAKGAGKKISPAVDHDEPAVINLMDALKRSLNQTGGKKTKAKPARKAKATKRRRKTG